MPIKPAAVAAAALVMLALPAATADSLSAAEASWLLEIGGAGGTGWADAAADARWQGGGIASGPACERLDLEGGVRDFMEQAAAGGESLRNQAYQSATATVTGLPWLTLRRALPEVADLFDAELARAEGKARDILNRCERQIGNPASDDWQQAARNQAWQLAGKLASTPEQADTMAQAAASQGVRWIDGEKRGGENQPPIFVIAETFNAGAALLLSREELRAAGWDSVAEAGQWIAAVVGDVRVHLSQQTDSARPGTGLWPKVRDADKTLSPIVLRAVDKRRRGESIDEEMVVLRAGRAGIQPSLLDKISRSRLGWRQQAIARLAYELALAHTLDKALLARQCLLTGLQIPQIAALQPAEKLVRQRLQQLEAEVQALLFEYRARQSLGSTMANIWKASDSGSASR